MGIFAFIGICLILVMYFVSAPLPHSKGTDDIRDKIERYRLR